LEYLTVSLAAKKAKTSQRTIYSWIYSGKLRAFKIHSRRGIRIAEPDLDECIKQFEMNPRQRVEKLIDLNKSDYDQEAAALNAEDIRRMDALQYRRERIR
jgi:excisionase family DNA binding protein